MAGRVAHGRVSWTNDTARHVLAAVFVASVRVELGEVVTENDANRARDEVVEPAPDSPLSLL